MIYGFDASATATTVAPTISRSLIPAGERAVDDVPREGCHNISPVAGVTGTPVIDRTSSTLYVVARTRDSVGLHHTRLHALDLATLADRTYSPVDMQLSESFGQFENQRAGLVLVQGRVFVTFAAHCDSTPYASYVFSFDAHTLNQVAAPFTTVLVGGDGNGIWQGGVAPAAVPSGGPIDLYFTTGNLIDTPTTSLYDNSLIHFTLTGSTTSVSNFVDNGPDTTVSPPMSYRDEMNANDWDLSSGAVTLLQETHW